MQSGDQMRIFLDDFLLEMREFSTEYHTSNVEVSNTSSDMIVSANRPPVTAKFVVNGLVLLLFCCSDPHGPEEYVMEKYPLCIITSDGTGYRELSVDGFGGAELFLNSDDSKILVRWGNSLYETDLSGSELRFLVNLEVTGVGHPGFSAVIHTMQAEGSPVP